MAEGATKKKTMDDYKSMYRHRRTHFRGRPDALEELEMWKNRDANHDYTVLNGLIPSKVIGNRNFKDAFVKCDTWFSEYTSHNASNQVLSSTDESYIIGNLASYDSRQYPPWLNPTFNPGVNTPEGQGFGHCLVIPRQRIFNIVDPDAVADHCAAIHELHQHFLAFWSTRQGRQKILDRTRASFDEQNVKLAADPANRANYAKLLPQIEDGWQKLSKHFLKLKGEDFEFAFHAFPDNSVGHLHMHVFPKAEALRRFSTKTHDWKTIPMQAVVEVEEEDQGTEEVGLGNEKAGEGAKRKADVSEPEPESPRILRPRK